MSLDERPRGSTRPTPKVHYNSLPRTSIEGALVFVFIVFCGYLFELKWTGLVKNVNFHKRTLWDWLDLLIIPAVFAAAAFGSISANKHVRK